MDIPEIGKSFDGRIFDRKASSDADAGFGDSWNALYVENRVPSSFSTSANDARMQLEYVGDKRMAIFSQSSLDSVGSPTLAASANSESAVAHANAFCQTEVFTKDASIQTEFTSNCFTIENQLSQSETIAATVQSDPIKSLSSMVCKLKSSAKSKKKHASSTNLTPFVTKKSRKASQKKASVCSFTSLNTISGMISSCEPTYMASHCNNVFSGSPMFNSIAPSQPISSKATLPSLSGNIYVYHEQRGIRFPMSPMQQPGQKCLVKLNTGVVLSPLTVINPNDIGPQGDMHRPSIQCISTYNSFDRSPLSFSYVQSDYPNRLPAHVMDENDMLLSKSNAQIASTVLPKFTPICCSGFCFDKPYKKETEIADIGFPVPNSSSAFLPNPSHDKLLKQHFENRISSSAPEKLIGSNNGKLILFVVFLFML